MLVTFLLSDAPDVAIQIGDIIKQLDYLLIPWLGHNAVLRIYRFDGDVDIELGALHPQMATYTMPLIMSYPDNLKSSENLVAGWLYALTGYSTIAFTVEPFIG